MGADVKIPAQLQHKTVSRLSGQDWLVPENIRTTLLGWATANPGAKLARTVRENKYERMSTQFSDFEFNFTDENNYQLPYSILASKKGIPYAISDVFLGKGKSCRVKLAQNLSTGEFCAVLIFSDNDKHASHDMHLQNLEDLYFEQADSAVRVKAEKSKKTYHIMPLLPGKTLQSSLYTKFNIKRPIDILTKLQVALKILAQVKKLHDKDISHNDLHSNNFNFDEEDVRLLDFELIHNTKEPLFFTKLEEDSITIKNLGELKELEEYKALAVLGEEAGFNKEYDKRYDLQGIFSELTRIGKKNIIQDNICLENFAIKIEGYYEEAAKKVKDEGIRKNAAKVFEKIKAHIIICLSSPSRGPEVIKGSKASDAYSLGVLLACIFSDDQIDDKPGRMFADPVGYSDLYAGFFQNVHTYLRGPFVFELELQKQLREIVTSMMQREPNDRADLATVQKRLEGLKEQLEALSKQKPNEQVKSPLLTCHINLGWKGMTTIGFVALLALASLLVATAGGTLFNYGLDKFAGDINSDGKKSDVGSYMLVGGAIPLCMLALFAVSIWWSFNKEQKTLMKELKDFAPETATKASVTLAKDGTFSENENVIPADHSDIASSLKDPLYGPATLNLG
jgi:serine/threonine protein kinase